LPVGKSWQGSWSTCWLIRMRPGKWEIEPVQCSINKPGQQDAALTRLGS